MRLVVAAVSLSSVLFALSLAPSCSPFPPAPGVPDGGGCPGLSCGACQPALHIRLFGADGGQHVPQATVFTDAGYASCSEMSCEIQVNGPQDVTYTISAPGYVAQTRTDTVHPGAPPQPGPNGCLGCGSCPQSTVDVHLEPADAGP